MDDVESTEYALSLQKSKRSRYSNYVGCGAYQVWQMLVVDAANERRYR